MVTKTKNNLITYEEPIQKKKKKKKDRGATKEPELDEQPSSGIQKQGMNKCKRKKTLVAEVAADPGEEQSEEISIIKKKKKKKSKLKEELILDHVLCAEDNGMETDHLEPNCLEVIDEVLDKSKMLKKKKKPKIKKECIPGPLGSAEENDVDIDNQELNSLKPKEETLAKSKSLKKRKKKRNILLLAEDDNKKLHKPDANDVTSVKKRKRHSAAAETKNVAEKIVRSSEDTHEEVIKKKKKKQCEEEEMIHEYGAETGECGFAENNRNDISTKRKKKKKVQKITEDSTIIDVGISVSRDKNEFVKPKSKTNFKIQMSESTPPKGTLKPKKKKKVQVKQEEVEATERVGDVQIVSVKKGNTDEVNIDKIRRQALQAEVDRESGKVKAPVLGQWQTASFENSDQQMKFFRLMGGFKKSSQLSPVQTTSIQKPNMALSKTGVETLKQNLNSEFEKALGLKQHRGIGLGFQPAAKKTFYIDKTKSKSIKFDD